MLSVTIFCMVFILLYALLSVTAAVKGNYDKATWHAVYAMLVLMLLKL